MRPDRDDDRDEERYLKQIAKSLKDTHSDIHVIHADIHEIVDLLKQVLIPKPHFGAYVAAIHGRSRTMAVQVPVPKLLDTEKILLSVMPRKADGHVDTSAIVSWVSSDPSQVGIEVGVEAFDFVDPQFGETVSCPGAFNCYALTPNSTGVGTVTVSASSYESAEFGPIEYAPGVARSLNASVGGPLSDV